MTSVADQCEPSEADAARAGIALRCSRFVGRNLPLVAGGLLFAHLAWHGLRPALDEQDRLQSVGAEVRQRHADLELEARTLERRRAALEDPFYRERLRRAAASDRTAESAAPSDADPAVTAPAPAAMAAAGPASEPANRERGNSPAVGR